LKTKVLTRALKCHPAVIVFPSWDIEHKLIKAIKKDQAQIKKTSVETQYIAPFLITSL
jgi:hypothetical protein